MFIRIISPKSNLEPDYYGFSFDKNGLTEVFEMEKLTDNQRALLNIFNWYCIEVDETGIPIEYRDGKNINFYSVLLRQSLWIPDKMDNEENDDEENDDDKKKKIKKGTIPKGRK